MSDFLFASLTLHFSLRVTLLYFSLSFLVPPTQTEFICREPPHQSHRHSQTAASRLQQVVTVRRFQRLISQYHTAGRSIVRAVKASVVLEPGARILQCVHYYQVC